jgi:hypothetical protein
MRSGTLTRRLVTIADTLQLDEFGVPSPATSTAKSAIPCALVEQTAVEKTTAAGAVTVAQIKLRTRHTTSIAIGDRAQLDAVDYVVRGITEIGRRRELEIVLERAGP